MSGVQPFSSRVSGCAPFARSERRYEVCPSRAAFTSALFESSRRRPVASTSLGQQRREHERACGRRRP